MIKPTKRKAFNFLRSYFDVLNELQNDKDRLSFLLSIINKQFLDEDPKELNFISNLCYESQRHQIESSVNGWKRANKYTLITDPTTTPPTTPRTNPKEEEEKEKEKEEYTKAAALPFSFYNSLIKLGGEKQLVSDWLEVRKNKNATNSKTAFNGFKKQLEKTNSDINKILTLCVEKSWAGFKAEWFENEQPKKTSQKATFNNPII